MGSEILGTFFLVALVFAQIVMADNPLNSYRSLADPNPVVINNRVYIYASNDDDNTTTSYDMKSYVLLSSKDLKNWTDHGEVFRVPRDASWARLAYAPTAVWKNNKMYLYFPNGAGGIGVAISNYPEGPFTDPLGKALINTTLCDGVAWCFDPSVFIDDDGQAYLYYGGGSNNDYTYGFNLRVIKLNANMTSVQGSPTRITGTTNSFEAPYMHKYGGNYYLSFNTRSQTIDYSMSSNPMTGFSFKGRVMENPSINGTNINLYNNSHQGLFQFGNKWYAAYHDRRVFKADYKRNLSLDELLYNANGTITSVTYTNSGPAQVGRFNPYDSILATTMATQAGVRGVTNSSRKNYLVPLKSSTTAWIRIAGVDFGLGAATFRVSAASLNANNKVEVRTGSISGALAGTCNLVSTGSWTAYKVNTCNMSGLTGVQDLYLKFTGTDSSSALDWWRFVAATSTSSAAMSSSATSSVGISSSSAGVWQAPYSTMIVIPGTIQAENYDLGGEGVAYHDADATNSGNTYRADDVDIDGDAISGFKVGWTSAGEWLEYTVNVLTTGVHYWTAFVSSGADNSSIRLLMDGVDISGSIPIPNGGSWNAYTPLSGTTTALSSGQHVLRVQIEGAYCNLDWISLSLQDPVYIRQNHSSKLPIMLWNPSVLHDLKGRTK